MYLIIKTIMAWYTLFSKINFSFCECSHPVVALKMALNWGKKSSKVKRV